MIDKILAYSTYSTYSCIVYITYVIHIIHVAFINQLYATLCKEQLLLECEKQFHIIKNLDRYTFMIWFRIF